jgi:hypothetical protein
LNIVKLIGFISINRVNVTANQLSDTCTHYEYYVNLTFLKGHSHEISLAAKHMGGDALGRKYGPLACLKCFLIIPQKVIFLKIHFHEKNQSFAHCPSM